MEIIQVLAANPSGDGLGIGFKNGLPWNIPADLEHFKKLTEGSAVLMGRKTLDSLPFKNGLPNRFNLVLTRGDSVHNTDNVVSDHNIGTLISYAKLRGYNKVFIIGGAEIYEQSLLISDKVVITIVEGTFEIDTILSSKYIADLDEHFTEEKIDLLSSGEEVLYMVRG